MACSSLLKKGSDPLRPSFFSVKQQGLQRVRPLFQQADNQFEVHGRRESSRLDCCRLRPGSDAALRRVVDRDRLSSTCETCSGQWDRYSGGPRLATNIELGQSGDLGGCRSRLRNRLPNVFKQLVRLSLERGQNLHHPHYIGHQVPAPSPLAGLFDAVTTLTNQVQGVYEMGPWGVSVERAVLARIADAIGLAGDYGGLVTSGGSLANLTALLAARNIACPDIWHCGTSPAGNSVPCWWSTATRITASIGRRE